MAVSFTQSGNLITFSNSDGTWSVWTTPTYNSTKVDRVGPGYIGKYVTPNGKTVVDDFHSLQTGLNDPNYGGLGAVGWHHARANGQTNVYNRTWDLTIRGDASLNGFGVCATRLTNGPYINPEGAVRFTMDVDISDQYSYPFPVMRVTYDYKVEDTNLKQWITFTSLWDGGDFPLYIKEPKIVASVNPNYTGGSRYRNFNLYDRVNNLLASRDLTKIPDPWVQTQQFGDAKRCRATFTNELNGLAPFHIIAEASPGSFSGTRYNWEKSGYGLDLWATNSNSRQIFEASGAAYCTQGPGGTLTRQWELTKRSNAWNTDIMFHGWEGGSGYPDCLRVYRAWPDYGEQYTVYMDYSLGTGFLV